MAIAFDAYSSANTTGTSVTLSHTCTGSNLAVMNGIYHGGTTDKVTGVTYSGDSLTRASTTTTTNVRVYMYFRNNAPATGANDMVVSLSSSTNTYQRITSVTGAKQAVAADSTATDSCSSSCTDVTLTFTTVADNCWIFGVARNEIGSWVAGTDTTVREAHSIVGFDSNSAKTPAGSSTITCTIDSGGVVAGAGVAIEPIIVNSPIASVKTWNTLTIA